MAFGHLLQAPFVAENLGCSRCADTWGFMLLLLSCFSRVRLCATPEMAAHHAPPSLGFSRQEHWSGLNSPRGFMWQSL